MDSAKEGSDMADDKRTDKERAGTRRYSGFDAPVYGMPAPEGSVIRHNPDGTVSVIPPENASGILSDRSARSRRSDKLSEEELKTRLLQMFPDGYYDKIGQISFLDKELWKSVSSAAYAKDIKPAELLRMLGFERRKNIWTAEKILERLNELYPSGKYPSAGSIGASDPELYKHLSAVSKEGNETVTQFLARHGFRKSLPEMHTNRLDQPWDRQTLKRLYYEYDVTFEQFAELFGCSKQTISNHMKSRNDNGNDGGWEAPLSEEEYSDAAEAIMNGEIRMVDSFRTVLVLNGRRDSGMKAVVYKTSETVTCIFDGEHVFASAFAYRKERLAETVAPELFSGIEDAWIRQGEIVSGGLKQVQCSASMLQEIRFHAEESGTDMTAFMKSHGYALAGKDSQTKDRLAAYIVPGTENIVSISTKDTFYRTLSVAARRKGFSGIKEYVASFGFKLEGRMHDSASSYMRRTVTSPEAVRRTIERIRPYVLPGTNIVKIDTSAPDYNYLVFTANARGYSSFKEMLEEYGFYYEGRRGKHSRNTDIGYDPDVLRITEERYKVDDTSVYISSYDPFYYRLNNYALLHGKKMDEFLAEHGYSRIKKACDLPDDYIPYDYTDDVLRRIDGNWSEEKLREILGRLAEGKTVRLNESEYLFAVLMKISADAGMPVREYAGSLGYVLQMAGSKQAMPEEEKALEDDAVKKELSILRSIQSEYTHVHTESVKVKRNQMLVKVLKSMYKGQCQLCGDASMIPPIFNSSGERYCEVHHINPVSSIRTDSDVDEIDSYKNTIVLCPYHHSFLHHQNGGGFVLENRDGKLFLVNHRGDAAEIMLNYHLDFSSER